VLWEAVLLLWHPPWLFPPLSPRPLVFQSSLPAASSCTQTAPRKQSGFQVESRMTLLICAGDQQGTRGNLKISPYSEDWGGGQKSQWISGGRGSPPGCCPNVWVPQRWDREDVKLCTLVFLPVRECGALGSFSSFFLCSLKKGVYGKALDLSENTFCMCHPLRIYEKETKGIWLEKWSLGLKFGTILVARGKNLFLDLVLLQLGPSK
jgi:hypothetical protein